MKSLPSTTTGWLYADVVTGSPNAHFSWSLETDAGDILAALTVWKRVLFSGSGLHPFHDAAEGELLAARPVGQRLDMVLASPFTVMPIFLQPSASAIATFSSSLR